VVSGYKSGGTSTRSANATLFQNGFDEEDVISYELGYKAEFLNRRARLNTALFYMEMDGLQTSIQTGGTPGERDFLPIDDNTIQGLEFDFVYAFSGNLTASVSYGYLDTELGEDTVETVAGTFNLVDVYAYAPEHSGTVALDYNLPLKNGVLGAHLGYSYQDESEASVNAADGAIINDRNLLDASLSWYDIRLGDLPGALKIQLWGKNLTDDEYYLVNTAAWAFVGANEVATFGDPRTYGLTLIYDY
jgi:iron complex outermembrane receptor protein